jgi:hypothetical protein
MLYQLSYTPAMGFDLVGKSGRCKGELTHSSKKKGRHEGRPSII